MSIGTSVVVSLLAIAGIINGLTLRHLQRRVARLEHTPVRLDVQFGGGPRRDAPVIDAETVRRTGRGGLR